MSTGFNRQRQVRIMVGTPWRSSHSPDTQPRGVYQDINKGPIVGLQGSAVEEPAIFGGQTRD